MGSPARAIPRTPEGLGPAVDVDVFVLPEGITQEFINFLKSVDAPEVRSMDLLCAVARAFLANGVGSKLEMVGVERADLTTSTLRLVLHVQKVLRASFLFGPGGLGLDAGAKGLVRRAINAANTSLVVAAGEAANSDAPRTEGNSVRDLVNVIKKEEVTVNIDLFTCINVRFCCTVLLDMVAMCLLSCRPFPCRVCQILVSPPRKQRTNLRLTGLAI